MKPKILAVGDVMLDRYVHGVVERISPEAPIPILRQTHVEDRPGGAANLACNLAALAAETVLVGCLGGLRGAPEPDAGSVLDALVARGGVRFSPCIVRDTTVKTRYVAMGQQMLRVDEDGSRPDPDDLDLIDEAVALAMPGCAALVLSDYAGGVLDRALDLIAMARPAGIPVYVDPKGTDWTKYCGASLIKPNEAELRAVLGDWVDKNRMLFAAMNWLQDAGIDDMLITHGAGGMTLVTKIGTHHHQPAVSGPVVDVTGAGDTVLACVAYLRAMGYDWPDTLRLAAKGAAAVCARHGTSAVSLDDLGMVVRQGQGLLAVPA